VKTFVLAGGCFWCLDAVYRTLKGVEGVVSGYTGGEMSDPTYELVCAGHTGHAEAVAVTFDPEVIRSNVILDVFFTLHDPTQLNRQGADIGTQYRSAMFYADDGQKDKFYEARTRAGQWWDAPIMTEISPLTVFYEAEDYQQNFFAKNPGQGYCLAVALPKVNKIRRSYADYVLT
jgi:peptide-methionine (S)-S-oxide reductase